MSLLRRRLQVDAGFNQESESPFVVGERKLANHLFQLEVLSAGKEFRRQANLACSLLRISATLID